MSSGVYQRTKKHKEKNRQAKLGKKNPMYGKKHTRTTKEKQRQAKLGKKYTEKTKEKIRENHADFSGKKNPFYGKKHSEATKQKQREAHLGKKNPFYRKKHSKITKAKMKENNSHFWLDKKHTEESKKKMRKNSSRYWLGKKQSEEHKEQIRQANLGKKTSEESKEKNRQAHLGKNNPNWQDGKSFEPYGIEFNNRLKEQIRERDYYRCQECFRHQAELFTKTGRKYKLTVHHIDYNKQNNNPNNLISLCRSCHNKTNFNREDWIKYFERSNNNK